VALFIARYDLRSPAGGGAERAALYRTALDQAAWCEEHDFDMLVLSEHHGVEDGYLPSPLVLASAMAARTSTIPLMVSALLVPLHDPVRLAEDIAVLDLISGGRAQYTAGLGYRREEYEQAGLDWSERGARMEHCLRTLFQAWTGEPFEHEGRTVQVTPTPLSSPRPMMFYGGGSKAAARRAARFDMPLFAQHGDPAVPEAYQAERAALGLPPGLALAPPQEGPGTIFVSVDPERTWDRIGSHLLYEATVYHSWQQGVTSAVHDSSSTVEEMRAAGVYAVMTPDECVDYADRIGPFDPVTTHPLCGGIPPEVSWEHLELLGTQVIPRVKAKAGDGVPSSG
jgi:alkanesulfonate monooxygenase SsuD/methylene tetrahydromethanopterin reductase-like flavin-dependent oxidoreductase (luciferase family)